MSLTYQEQENLASTLRQHGWDCHMPKVADPNVDPDIVDKLGRTIDELNLSTRASNRLQYLNIRYLYELVPYSEAELLKARYLGSATLREISNSLAVLGLHLGTPANDPNVLVARAR